MKSKSLLPLVFLLGAAAVIVPGCQLLPKRVEFFQKKVTAVPELSLKDHETQRQAAAYVADKTEEAKVAAVASDSPAAVLTPISDAHTAAEGLTVSLGPPADPWKREAEVLAQKLRSQKADYEHDLEKYRQRVEPLEGKKIEGTGKLSMPYFVWLGVIVGVVMLIGLAVKVLAMIYPPVGAGYTALSAAGRVSSSVLSRGFAEVVEGGEKFVNSIEQSKLASFSKEQVVSLFKLQHQTSQSRDVQDVVDSLTAKPGKTVISPEILAGVQG